MPGERERERERAFPHLVFLFSYYFLGRLFVVVSFGGIPLLPSRASAPFLVTFLKLITSVPSASFVSFPSRWSVRVPTLPLHLFPDCCSVSSAHLGKWLRPYHLLPLHSRVLSFLILQDLTSSFETFFLPSRSLLLSSVYTLPRDVYAVRIAGRNPAGQTLSTAFPIFHAAARRSEEDSLPITHCPLQLKLPDRTRTSVGCPPVDSTFLRRLMLICSLFLLFVRGNRHLWNRYRTGPYRVEHDINFIRFLDKTT